MTFRPVKITLTINTEADLRALHLRANLDAQNVKSWYHDHRNRPAVIAPDVGTKDLYKVTKSLLASFGLTVEDPNYRAPVQAQSAQAAQASQAAPQPIAQHGGVSASY